MKSFLFYIVALFAIFAVTYAADCELKGHKFNRGEKYTPPGECTQITCDGPNSISQKGCPVEHTLKPCKYIAMDASKPYPQCCPKFEC